MLGALLLAGEQLGRKGIVGCGVSTARSRSLDRVDLRRAIVHSQEALRRRRDQRRIGCDPYCAHLGPRPIGERREGHCGGDDRSPGKPIREVEHVHVARRYRVLDRTNRRVKGPGVHVALDVLGERQVLRRDDRVDLGRRERSGDVFRTGIAPGAPPLGGQQESAGVRGGQAFALVGEQGHRKRRRVRACGPRRFQNLGRRCKRTALERARGPGDDGPAAEPPPLGRGGKHQGMALDE